MKIPLLGGTGEDRALDNSQAYTQNWYVSKSSGKSGVVLYPTPGLTQFADIGAGPIRGSIDYDGIYFIVSGNTLYEIDAAGNGVSRGTLNTTIGRCSLAHNGANNGKQICIVDGVDLYIWDSNGSDFKVITDSADGDYDADCPTGATHVAFFDGFFVINNPAYSGRFNKSAGYDGTSWDALEFATAERSPDELQGLVVSNRTLWLVGKSTAEPWFNSGAADFPFEPIQSGFSQFGTIAPYSLIEIAGMVFWLSQNDEGSGMVIANQGGMTQAISSGEIAVSLSKLSTLSDAYAYSYQYQQHVFYVLTFPTDKKTFVYDIAMKEWHNWSTKSTGYHRSSTHTFVYNKHLVGDPITGKIYYLDWDKYLDNEETITRIRRSNSIHGDDKEIIHDAVWIDIKEGVGYVLDLGTEDKTIYSVSTGSPATVVMVNHGVETGETITLSGTTCTPSADGDWVATKVNDNSFTIPLSVSTLGLGGTLTVRLGTAENVANPQLQLRWRDSNGVWSNYHPRAMGEQGETYKRLIWRSLGRSFDRVYEMQTSAPVNAVIIDAYAKVRTNKREFG